MRVMTATSSRERCLGWGSKNWKTFRLGKQQLVESNQDESNSKYNDVLVSYILFLCGVICFFNLVFVPSVSVLILYCPSLWRINARRTITLCNMHFSKQYAQCTIRVRFVNLWNVVINDRWKNSGSCMVNMVTSTSRTTFVRRDLWTEELSTDLTKNWVCSVCFVKANNHYSIS